MMRVNSDPKWTGRQIRDLLDYMQNHKPHKERTSQEYYTKFVKQYSLERVDWKQVRSKCIYLQQTYSKVKNFCKSHKTYTRDDILRKCPVFYELEKIFDNKNSELTSETEDDGCTETESAEFIDDDSQINIKSEIEIDEEEESSPSFEVSYEVEPFNETYAETDGLHIEPHRKTSLSSVEAVEASNDIINDDSQKLKERMDSIRRSLSQNISQALLRKRTTKAVIPQTRPTVHPMKITKNIASISNTNSLLLTKNNNSFTLTHRKSTTPVVPIKLTHPILTKTGPVKTVLLSSSKFPNINISQKNSPENQISPELAVRKAELEFAKQKFVFEKQKYQDETQRKKEETESQERIRVSEIQLREKVAMRELEMKERIALKEFEMKERLELEKFKLQLQFNVTGKLS